MEPQTKTCSCCKKILPLEDFHKSKKDKDGRFYECKSCHNEYRRKKFKENSKSPEFRQKMYEKSKKWRKENPDKIKRKRYKYRKYSKEYYKKYGKKRYNTDIQYKLKSNFSVAIRKVLKGIQKSGKIFSYLGCSAEEFKEYIESKFTEGMSWENRGPNGWHIDHIIPYNAFDLTKEEDRKKCLHYTNTQPLWAVENIKKGNKISNQPF